MRSGASFYSYPALSLAANHEFKKQSHAVFIMTSTILFHHNNTCFTNFSASCSLWWPRKANRLRLSVSARGKVAGGKRLQKTHIKTPLQKTHIQTPLQETHIQTPLQKTHIQTPLQKTHISARVAPLADQSTPARADTTGGSSHDIVKAVLWLSLRQLKSTKA